MPKVCLRANEIGANRAQAQAYLQACTHAVFPNRVLSRPSNWDPNHAVPG
jgi:hypothetical protein